MGRPRNWTTESVVAARTHLDAGPAVGDALWSLKLHLITPMTGGGVETKAVVQGEALRAPALRGSLRHWWRCCFAPRWAPTGDLALLRVAEAALFGMASVAPSEEGGAATAPIASAVDVRIKRQSGPASGSSREVSGTKVSITSGHGYVYFPLRETRETKAGSYHWGVAATVEVHLDRRQLERNLNALSLAPFDAAAVRAEFEASASDQVAAALWAWSHFGGYGARTRRGAGAMRVSATGPHYERISNTYQRPEQVVRALTDAATAFKIQPAAGTHFDFPLLGSSVVVVGELELGRAQDEIRSRGTTHRVTLEMPERVACGVGSIMRDFRQDRDKGRVPGRSYWPEADSIRRIAGYRARVGRNPDRPDFWPRAALGLPLVVKFKSGDGDPDGQWTLRPKVEERLASPIVLRPLPTSSNDNYLVLCLRLHTPLEPPSGLALETPRGLREIPEAQGPIDGGATFGSAVPMLESAGSNYAPHAFVEYFRWRHRDRGVTPSTLLGQEVAG